MASGPVLSANVWRVAPMSASVTWTMCPASVCYGSAEKTFLQRRRCRLGFSSRLPM